MSSQISSSDELLRVSGLKKSFPITKGVLLRRRVGEVKAIDGIDLTIRRGQTLGLVGESGCGKSTTARCILRLLQPTEGEIWVEGTEVTSLKANELRELRREMQIVFQDPYASLNPRMTVFDIVSEPLKIHGLWKSSGRSKVRDLLARVGLNPEHGNRYPHEFSGGQRQRIGIARALALEPKLIICDEPVSALDVSIQAQIINLLEDLQTELGLTYLFIAHDLSIVRHISDHVAVMYLGRIVAFGDRYSLYEKPMHPYAQALLSAVPIPDPSTERKRERIILRGDVPSPVNPPSGCRFHTRCFLTEELARSGEVTDTLTIGTVRQREVATICVEVDPPLVEHDPDNFAACHFARARKVI